jgi:hypothetical protein
MVIDAALARGIRRGYMRHLRDAWRAHRLKSIADGARNRLSCVDTQKAYRKSLAACRSRLGTLLGVTELEVNTPSRSGWLALSLVPVFDEGSSGSADALECYASFLLRPGGAGSRRLRVSFSGHALDRIIQRSGLINTPVTEQDVRAINAEFADALHYASPAFAAITTQPGDDAGRLTLLLPSPHGFFLGRFDPAESMLRVKTFVDESRLRRSQREALLELNGIDQGRLALVSFSMITPGWLGCADADLSVVLLRIWRELDWRREPGLAGMSDAAGVHRRSAF